MDSKSLDKVVHSSEMRWFRMDKNVYMRILETLVTYDVLPLVSKVIGTEILFAFEVHDVQKVMGLLFTASVSFEYLV